MSWYSQVASSAYTEQLQAIGNYRRMDDALEGISWALGENPKVFGIVDGMKDVRLLKTDIAGDVPALRIWFKIDDQQEKIHLLWVETITGANDDE